MPYQARYLDRNNTFANSDVPLSLRHGFGLGSMKPVSRRVEARSRHGGGKDRGRPAIASGSRGAAPDPGWERPEGRAQKGRNPGISAGVLRCVAPVISRARFHGSVRGRPSTAPPEARSPAHAGDVFRPLISEAVEPIAQPAAVPAAAPNGEPLRRRPAHGAQPEAKQAQRAHGSPCADRHEIKLHLHHLALAGDGDGVGGGGGGIVVRLIPSLHGIPGCRVSRQRDRATLRHLPG